MNKKKYKTSKRSRFYNDLVHLYDFICTPQNRKRDVAVLVKIIKCHLESSGKQLLDVACGTGLEDRYLKKTFDVTGLDLSRGVLRIARKRNPEIHYLHGDMRNFRLNASYDVITCFDAMCYLQNYGELRRTLGNFYRHLKPGGLLIFYIDPVFLKEHHKQDTIIVNRKTRDKKTIVLLEVYHKYGRKIRGYAAYLIITANRARFEADALETFGFFEVERIIKILRSMGLRTYMYNTDDPVTFSLEKYDANKQCPVFVCEKPRSRHRPKD